MRAESSMRPGGVVQEKEMKARVLEEKATQAEHPLMIKMFPTARKKEIDNAEKD